MRDAINKIDGIGVYLAPQPLITVLGVKYLHLRVEDGTDLYVTEHGLPFTKCLMPENHWADEAWMETHGFRLPGTSAVHRVMTKKVDGRSKEIVIKWNRMGQDIPGETQVLDEADAEFNTPFMEFSLLIELRSAQRESPQRLRTHKPLAIFVPRKYVQAEQLGRRRHKMEAIQRSHDDEIAIDWNRNYAVIYEWIKGIETTYSRAIYMTGSRSTVLSSLIDDSRYESHAQYKTPDGQPVLSRQHEYLTIWGYWNGPDDALAIKDEAIYAGVDALAAYREGRLTQRSYVRVMRAAKKRLAAVGIEDLNLRGNHLMLSVDRHQKLAVDDKGLPLFRICNFELFKTV